MKKPLLVSLVLIAVAALVVVGTQRLGKEATMARYIEQHDSITLSEQFDKPIEAAFLVCEYAEAAQYEEFGFNPKDFYSINNNWRRWESSTGIALKFAGGDTEVMYFDPTRINACAMTLGDRPLQIDPTTPIRIGEIDKQFAGRNEPQKVRVFDFR